MTDIQQLIERLRKHVREVGGPAKDDDGNLLRPHGAFVMMLEAADALEAQQAEIERLLGALGKIASGEGMHVGGGYKAIAREALGGKDELRRNGAAG